MPDGSDTRGLECTTLSLGDGRNHQHIGDREMTPASLQAWRERLYGSGYGTRSVETACEALGLSRRAYDSYEAGEHRIPRYIELACRHLEWCGLCNSLNSPGVAIKKGLLDRLDQPSKKDY